MTCSKLRSVTGAPAYVKAAEEAAEAALKLTEKFISVSPPPPGTPTGSMEDLRLKRYDEVSYTLSIRTSVLKELLPIWEKGSFIHGSTNLLNPVLRILGVIVSAKGETQSGGKPPIKAVGDELVARLMTMMGATREQALQALTETESDMETAVEILLHRMNAATHMEEDDEEGALERALQMSMEEDGSTEQEATVERVETPTPHTPTPEEAQLEYKQLRDKLRELLAGGVLEILNTGHPASSAVLKLALLLCQSDKDGFPKAIVDGVHNVIHGAGEHLKAPLHILALLLQDTGMSVGPMLEDFLPDFMTYCQRAFSSEQVPVWTAQAMLLFLNYGLLTEPPRSDPLRVGDAAGTKEDDPHPRLYTLEEKHLLLDLILLLLQKQLQADDLDATLRLLILMTRESSFAEAFAAKKGIESIMRATHPVIFKGQVTMCLIALHHCLDTREALRQHFTEELRKRFARPHGPRSDTQLTTLLRETTHLTCRDPVLFVDVVDDLCTMKSPTHAPERSAGHSKTAIEV